MITRLWLPVPRNGSYKTWHPTVRCGNTWSIKSNQVNQAESTPTESAPIGQDSGDGVIEGSRNEELLVEMLIEQRSEIRDQIKTGCDELSDTWHMGGSLSQLNTMIVKQSEVLNDQICEFTELVDTAAVF